MESNFLVTARKFRPQQFSSVVGQNHITKTLKNAIKSNRIHHAYLFNGPRGVGKTTSARIFARALNCLNLKDGEPCNECESCRNSLEGRSLDIIEIDGASNNSVDDVRKLRENAKFPPVQGRFKMYIIDEVHMLSTSAFNALLKTLEEPPKHLMFVFATTEPHKVPATILSRCQRFDFRRMEINDIIFQLKFITEQEQIIIDDQSLYAIAKKADGSMRDAESIFDQVVAFTGDNIEYSKLADALHLIDEEFYFEISQNIFSNNILRMFEIANEVAKRGYDYLETISGFIEHLRNLLSVKAIGNASLMQVSDSVKDKYIEYANKFDISDLLRIIQVLVTSEQQLKYSSQQRIRFELILVRLASMINSKSINEIIESIEKEEKSYKNTQNLKVQLPSISENKVQFSSELRTPKAVTKQEVKIDMVNEPVVSVKTSSDKILSKSSLESKWTDFLLQFANTKNNLASLTKLDVEFDDNKISIIFSSELVYNNYHENNSKEKITKFVNEYYNGNLNVEFILKNINKEIDTKNTSTKSTLEQDLSELFNAEKLN